MEGVRMIGFRMTQLRKDKKLTQTKVAKALNIAQGSYSLYELDKRSPDYETLKRIAKYYNVSISYLLGETDQKNFEQQVVAKENNTEEDSADLVNIKNLSDIEKIFFKAYIQLDCEIRQKLVEHFSEALESHRNELNAQKDIDAEVERYRLELEAERLGKTLSASGGRKKDLG